MSSYKKICLQNKPGYRLANYYTARRSLNTLALFVAFSPASSLGSSVSNVAARTSGGIGGTTRGEIGTIMNSGTSGGIFTEQLSFRFFFSLRRFGIVCADADELLFITISSFINGSNTSISIGPFDSLNSHSKIAP